MQPLKPFSATQRLALNALPPLLGLTLRGLAASWRVRESVPDASHPRRAEGPLIYAMWHQCVVTVTGRWRDHAIQGLASQSFDGALIARTLGHLGLPEPSRGSSSRGGVDALRSHGEALRAGRHVVVTVDGPRGPAYHAKPGVLRMAHESGRPIVAVACAVDPMWRLKSWDRTQLPPPGAKVAFVLSRPFPVLQGHGALEVQRLDQVLGELQREAEQLLSR